MKTSLAPGFHVAAGRAVDSAAYDQFTGQWSRLFVPSVLNTAGVDQGCRVLDVATGTGEAALAIAPVIGASGLLVDADIAPTMFELRVLVLDCTNPNFALKKSPAGAGLSLLSSAISAYRRGAHHLCDPPRRRFGMLLFALVRHLAPDRAARFGAALLGLGEIALAAMAAVLTVFVTRLDSDFSVMFLALVRHLAPDGASGFPDTLLLLREIAAMALANKMARIAWKLMVTGDHYAAKAASAALAGAG